MDRTEHVRPRSCRTLAHQRGVLEGGGDGELQVSSKGNPHEPRVTLVRPAEPKPTAADKARPSGRAPRRKGMPLVVRLNNR